MTLEIVYDDLVKTFKLEGNKLFRLFKRTGRFGVKGEWVEVKLEANHPTGYCRIGWNGRMFGAHRILYSLYHQVDVDTTLVIDHKNGDKIDNSVENLCLVDNRQNQCNRTGHRNGRLVGCYFHKQHKKWMAYIRINKKQFFLGLYSTEIEAHQVYKIALELFNDWGLTGLQIQEIIKELQKENCL